MKRLRNSPDKCIAFLTGHRGDAREGKKRRLLNDESTRRQQSLLIYPMHGFKGFLDYENYFGFSRNVSSSKVSQFARIND